MRLRIEIEATCGNCRHLQRDEHGGGRNVCLALERGEEFSERYKYIDGHVCDTQNEARMQAFEPNTRELDDALKLIRSGYPVDVIYT